MENRLFIEDINARFRDSVLSTTEHSRLRITVTIIPEAVVNLTEFFYKEKGFRFITASGLHSKQGFEIFYHFSNDMSGHVINLHVVLQHEQPVIQSLTEKLSAANWIEREIHELLGIDFKGHPNLVPLLSKDNWPEGTYPYQKDFK